MHNHLDADMGRAMIALFIVSFFFDFVAFWTGVVGCWRRGAGNITSTAILMLLACKLLFLSFLPFFLWPFRLLIHPSSTKKTTLVLTHVRLFFLLLFCQVSSAPAAWVCGTESNFTKLRNWSVSVNSSAPRYCIYIPFQISLIFPPHFVIIIMNSLLAIRAKKKERKRERHDDSWLTRDLIVHTRQP